MMFALSNGVPSVAKFVRITAGAFDSTPVVNIDLPLDGDLFPSGATITFAARANDPADGDLSALLDWYSDSDGFLGSGSPLSVTLSDGIHTITASANDSTLQSGSDSIDIMVGPPVVCGGGQACTD